MPAPPLPADDAGLPQHLPVFVLDVLRGGGHLPGLYGVFPDVVVVPCLISRSTELVVTKLPHMAVEERLQGILSHPVLRV